MTAVLRAALLGLAVVLAVAHDFKAGERAFQRSRTRQTIEELNTVLPNVGRIQRSNGPTATLTANPGRYGSCLSPFLKPVL
jgi:hypothetical protein